MNEITKAEMRKRLGNITQLQELLFGEKTKEYNQKLSQYNQRLYQLESDAQKFQLVFEEHLEQLETRLINKINSLTNSLERKVSYLGITTQEEQSKLQKEVEAVSKHSYENVDFLQNSLNAQTNSLKTEITQSKAALDRDLRLLKQQIFDKLESNLAELSSAKVSRNDLAEVLFELCLKLKQPSPDLELPASHKSQEPEDISNHHNRVDLILPEKN